MTEGGRSPAKRGRVGIIVAAVVAAAVVLAIVALLWPRPAPQGYVVFEGDLVPIPATLGEMTSAGIAEIVEAGHPSLPAPPDGAVGWAFRTEEEASAFLESYGLPPGMSDAEADEIGQREHPMAYRECKISLFGQCVDDWWPW